MTETTPNKTDDKTLPPPKPYKNKHFVEPMETDPEPKTPTEVDPLEGEENLTPEEKTFKKRYSDLRSYSSKTINELKGEINKLQTAIKEVQTEAYKPPANDKDLAAWQKKYPEVAGYVETLAEKRASEHAKALQAKLEAAEQRMLELAQERAMAQIERKHPDFPQLREDEGFHKWAQSQPKHIQDWLYENYDNPDLVIRAVDLYKLDSGILSKTAAKTRKENKTEAASTLGIRTPVEEPNDRSKKVWKESEIARLSGRQFEKYEEEIMQARAEGRIELDLTKR